MNFQPDFATQPITGRITAADEEKGAVQNTLGFGFWNLSRSFEHFAKTAKEAMRGYCYKLVRRVR